MLKQSSSELIRSLKSHARTLCETRSNDKKRIQDLEKELSNCSQEIDYLQDQLTTRDTEISHMTYYIQNLELKVNRKEDLDGIVRKLEQELKACKLENLNLMKKLEDKEHELRNSTLYMEKLEESISDITLDFQCDIESMKLDLMAMEHSFLEAKKLQDEAAQNVTQLVDENKALREKLNAFEQNSDSETKMKKTNEYEARIHDYELLVTQLKEQLKDEKFKANEEAEELAQEMAELRYQLTGLLEEEYKKRACIEERALQRITELETQIEKERRKTLAGVQDLPNA